MRQLLSTDDIAERLPKRNGKKVHRSTLLRWIHRGVTVQGERVRLRATRIGAGYYVDPEDLDDFIAAQNPANGPTPPPTRSPAKRRRASEAAARELERMGV